MKVPKINQTPKNFFQAGYSLVELLLAIGLFGILVTSLFTGLISTREGKPQQEQRYIATSLFQETIEALRIVREQGWDQISTNGTYHPVETATSWTLSPGFELLNASTGLTRSVVIEDVYRDSNGNITLIGGTLDPSTKEITVTVSWDQPLVSSYSSTMYLTRYLDNLAFTHTTVADFDQAGAVANTVTYTSVDDGEVVLDAAGAGRGDWCNPGSSAVSELDLPRQGAARAITAIQGKVFSGTGENASGVSLAYVNVTDTIPPVTTLTGTFDGYKTNDVFGTDNYGFLATDTNNSEVVIVDLNDMSQAGRYDIQGPTNADSIFVSGSVGYVTAGSTLYTFDLSTIKGSSSQDNFDSIALAGTATSVYVVNGIAYVSIDSSSNQLQIFDVSNPSNISQLSSYSVDGAQAKDVYVSSDGNRAYLVTSSDASKNEFFIINTENKSAPFVISSYDTNGMDPRAVDVVLSNNMAIIVGVGAEEYQVVIISPENNPTYCGGYNDDTGIYDIDTVEESDGDAYAYINTGQTSSELKVIEGGPGGAFAMSGDYESAVFDTGMASAFNRLSFSSSLPADTTLQLQVAGAAAVGGDCLAATYNFVGPDGTGNTYFTSSPATIPFDSAAGGYDNPAQCFKYKAYFNTTNILSSPSLEDITVNYSP